MLENPKRQKLVMLGLSLYRTQRPCNSTSQGFLKSKNNLKKSNKEIMLTSLKIPKVERNVNSTGEDKDHTLIHFSVWIRNNEISDTQNQYTGSQNQ